MGKLDLSLASAYTPKSPYEIWQEWEAIPVYKGFIIQNLLELPLGQWERTGGKAAFVDLDGAGATCGAIAHEIAPGKELKPQRHLFEALVFILRGQGATTTPLSSRIAIREGRSSGERAAATWKGSSAAGFGSPISSLTSGRSNPRSTKSAAAIIARRSFILSTTR